MPRAQPGQRFGGRQKGTPNKVNAAVKDVLVMAAERLGGVDRLVEWVKEDPANEHTFWSSMYVKLLPLTLAGDKDNPLVTVQKIERALLAPGSWKDADATKHTEH